MPHDASTSAPLARDRWRRRRGRFGGVAAVLTVLGLAVATWALGNSDGVTPPVSPDPSVTVPASSRGTG